MNALAFYLALVTACCSTASAQEVTGRTVGARPFRDAKPVIHGSGVSLASELSPKPLAAGEPLTLETALQLAASGNPALVAKRKELGIAEGELKQASIYFQNNPELSLQVANRRFSPANEREITTTTSFDDLSGSFLSVENGLTSTESNDVTDFGIELSQEFEVFGQPRARRRAFTSARESVVADIASVQWEVLSRVRVEFYAAQIAHLRFELAENQYEFALSLLNLSKRQFDVGDISRLEYRQVEIQTASLQTRLISAKAELGSALESLRLTLGMPPSNSIRLSTSIPAITKIFLSEERVVEEILDVYPLLRLARLAVEQRQDELTLTKKEARPNITATLFFDREGDKESSSSRSFSVSDGFSFGRSSRSAHEEIFGLGVSVPLPLFNRGQGTIAAKKAAIEVARAEETAVRKELRSRARTALKRLSSSYASAALYDEDILPNILANLEQLENAYRQGELSLLDLRVNQRDLLDAQSAGLDSLSEYFSWRAEVEGLLGANFESGGNPRSESFEEKNDGL